MEIARKEMPKVLIHMLLLLFVSFTLCAYVHILLSFEMYYMEINLFFYSRVVSYFTCNTVGIHG